MPPIEEEQPEEEDRQAVATWLSNELERIERTAVPDPGRVTARRLNRTEYNNTIKDLLGVDTKPADDFPQDDAGYGFDNIADVLSLSPGLMEKYVTAADRVTRQALFGPPTLEPTLIRLRSEGRRVVEQRSVPASYDVTGLSLPNAFHAIHRIPVDGEYVIRVVLGGLRPKTSMPVTIALWVDDKEVQTRTHDQENAASFEIDRQDFGGQAVEFRVRLTAGDRWLAVAIPRIYEGLPARYDGPNPSTRPEVPRRVQGAAERDAGANRRGAQAVRREHRGAGEDPVERRAGEHRRRRRPLLVHEGAVAGEPREDLHVRPSRRRAREHLPGTHHHQLRAPGVPAAGHGARDGEVHRADAGGAEGRELVRRGAGGGAAGDPRLARLPLPHRARSPGARHVGDRDLGVQDFAARTGDAALLLPVGQHARRGAAAGG